jgi:hypothetical protein
VEKGLKKAAEYSSDAGDETMTTDEKRIIARMKKKYVRIKKMGDRWNTYLQIDHQGFTVVEQTTKKRAEFFGKMLAIALTRVNAE